VAKVGFGMQTKNNFLDLSPLQFLLGRLILFSVHLMELHPGKSLPQGVCIQRSKPCPLILRNNKNSFKLQSTHTYRLNIL
jgi:hypothetical protein